MTDINAPSRWTFCQPSCRECMSYHERQEMRRLNIDYLDQRFAELDVSAARAIRKLVAGVSHADAVYLYDDETVVIEFYADEDNPDNFEVTTHRVQEAREVIQQYLGDLWRVDYKHDGRYSDHRHPRKVAVKRIVAQDFKYSHESQKDYKRMASERPDGVDPDVDVWRDMERYSEEFTMFNRSNFFVYTTSSGVQHVLPLEGYENEAHEEIDGFSRRSVFEPVTTPCGTTSLDPQQVADGDTLVDYREYLRDHIDSIEDDHEVVSGADGDRRRRLAIDEFDIDCDPSAVLEKFCGACMNALYHRQSDDVLAEPKVTWKALLEGGDAR